MSKPSYDTVANTIWEPVAPKSDVDLEYLVHYATRAANSHNTQPRRFSGSRDQVRIRPDFSRATRAAEVIV